MLLCFTLVLFAFLLCRDAYAVTPPVQLSERTYAAMMNESHGMHNPIVEGIAEKIAHMFKSESDVLRSFGEPNSISRDIVTSVHNIDNDPKYMCNRSTFRYNGMVMRIVWLQNYSIIDYLSVSKNGFFDFGRINVGDSHNTLIANVGKPVEIVGNNVVYLASSSEMDELEIRMDFVLSRNKEIKQIIFRYYVDVEKID